MNPFPDSRSVMLDPATCRRARLSRDRRFDGEFFLAVRTTGIYCRPVCPARPPVEKNVTYFPTAAQAAAAGYRPCLRCRPESAPGSPAWNGSSTTVRRAMRLIQQGYLDEHHLGELAERLGIGERYLRKLFLRELGIPPRTVALNQRLLFARKLLAETSMPITQIAYAAGFGSVRRFNSAVREHFRLAPGDLRRQSPEPGPGIRLRLHYRPPYDWEGILAFYRRHALEGVEEVTGSRYRRNVRLENDTASFSIQADPGRDALLLELHAPDQAFLLPVVARIRRMFDLDANPAVFGEALAQDSRLAPLLQQFPGIRSPGFWSPFESATRAVVGQQVSTGAARGACARLAAAAAENADARIFPDPTALAGLDDSHFPMPGKRRETLRALGRAWTGGEDGPGPQTLAGLKGIGPWTLAIAAMRGTGDPDAFPSGDLGLRKAWRKITGDDSHLDARASMYWRPWRSYAANLLWRSLNP